MSKFGPTPYPILDPHRVQVWTHTVSKIRPASFSGPRCCLIPWSQVLPHFLVPGAVSCRVQQSTKENWVQTGPGMDSLTRNSVQMNPIAILHNSKALPDLKYDILDPKIPYGALLGSLGVGGRVYLVNLHDMKAIVASCPSGLYW